ncbi:MFS transporter [Paraburkholderia sp. EG286B]|uniref:MFS transporter n=1 Tax=Paraburkholderia sp. EG286B TaxID=3237011 RepID=UPI0034D2583C
MQNKGRENLLVLLLSLIWGFIFLDRMAIAFLTPELANVFHMSNTQIGQIMLATTLAYALSALLFSSFIDRTLGSRRGLATTVLLTSVFAAASAISRDYHDLLVFRILTGACEGPIFPLTMAILSRHSSEGRYALNVGLVQAGVTVICLTLGPTAVTHLEALFTWKVAFAISALPSLLLGIIAFRFLPEDSRSARVGEHDDPKSSASNRLGLVGSVLRVRNVWLSVVVCTLTLSGMWLSYTFGPLYWVKSARLTAAQMGNLASIMGLLQIFWVIGIPAISNYVGRRNASTVFLAIASAQMLSLYFVGPSFWTVSFYVVAGGIAGSATSLYMSLLGVESVPKRLAATSSSLIMGTAEIVGGAAAPMIAGSYADALGLPVVLLIGGICLAAGALLSLFFKETKAARQAAVSTRLSTFAD